MGSSLLPLPGISPSSCPAPNSMPPYLLDSVFPLVCLPPVSLWFFHSQKPRKEKCLCWEGEVSTSRRIFPACSVSSCLRTWLLTKPGTISDSDALALSGSSGPFLPVTSWALHVSFQHTFFIPQPSAIYFLMNPFITYIDLPNSLVFLFAYPLTYIATWSPTFLPVGDPFAFPSIWKWHSHITSCLPNL